MYLQTIKSSLGVDINILCQIDLASWGLILECHLYFV